MYTTDAIQMFCDFDTLSVTLLITGLSSFYSSEALVNTVMNI